MGYKRSSHSVQAPGGKKLNQKFEPVFKVDFFRKRKTLLEE